MPQALPVIGAAVVKFFTAKAIGYVIARVILTNLVLGAISKKLSKRGSNQQSPPPPINVTVRGTIENRRIVFGTRRTGGVLAFYDVYSTGGTTNDVLCYVIVLAGHQVDAIGDVFVDSRRVTSAQIHANGTVTGGPFAGKLWVYKHLGTGAQTVETNIDANFTQWTSDHRLQGCAYIGVLMQRDDEVYSQGAPQSISAVVDGALMYDSRLDSTNGGSGSHRADNPSTWEFSRNPALHARWYLTGGSVVNDQSTRMVRYGLKEPDSRIDQAYLVAAANVCDESITGAEQPPGGAEARYCCDLEVSCGEPRREILESILATMAGALTNEHGKWRLFAGAYDSPSHSFTQDDLYGPLECQDTDPHSERYNAVSTTYIDAGKQWIEQTTPFRTDSGYETQDGGERIPREIELRGVTSFYQAQRIAELELRKSRMMRTIKLVGALNLLKIAKHETFTLTHSRYGWTNRVFRCIERQFEFNEDAGRVTITASQEDAGVYADLLTADYLTGTSETDVFTYEAPDAPVSLVTTGYAMDVLLTVGLPDVFQAGSVIEIWEHTSSTPFSSATKVAEDRSTKITVPHRDTTTRYYWATIKNTRGVRSDPYPSGSGVAGTATFINTTDLTPDSVTEIYSSDADLAGSAPISSYFIDFATFTPAESGVVVVTFNCNGKSSLDKDSGSYIQLAMGLTSALQTFSGWTRPDASDPDTEYGTTGWLQTFTSTVSIAYEFAVTGGVQYSIGAQAFKTAGTMNIYDTHLRLFMRMR